MENNFNLKDLNFVRDVAPEMADMILDVCKFNVDEMHDSLTSPKNINNKFVTDLELDKRTEMVGFYQSMMDIFVEFEMYEYCAKLLFVIESLEITEDKVGI